MGAVDWRKATPVSTFLAVALQQVAALTLPPLHSPDALLALREDAASCVETLTNHNTFCISTASLSLTLDRCPKDMPSSFPNVKDRLVFSV